MATAKPTKQEEDDQLRKVLEHADVKKFEKAIKQGFEKGSSTAKKSAKKK